MHDRRCARAPTRYAGHAGHAARASRRPAATRRRGLHAAYALALAWCFSLFSALRLVAYLPTLWAMQQSGDTSGHSLWTWGTWLGANLTMAAWLHEQADPRVHHAVLVNLGNAAMCGLTCALILWHR